MDKRDLKNYYNRKAKELDEIIITYESPSLYKRFFFNTRFNKVVKALSPRRGEIILDLGCGAGYYTNYLIKKGCKVFATDISDEYVKQTKKYTNNNAKYYISDAAILPFKSNYFDKVLMTEVIEHLPDPQNALMEVKRVLKVEGVAVITTPNKFSYMNLAYTLKRKIRKYKFNEHLTEYSQKEFSKLLSKYFQIEDVFFSNHLLPYPIDNLFINLKSKKIISFLKFLERKLSGLYLVKNLGWTMIYQVKKT